MRNRAIIAPFWAAVDEYVAFKVNHSRVYYQVYSHTKPKGNRTSHILNMASQHVQIYDGSGKFHNFSATWVLVVTWKDLCPFFYYGLPRLQCRWNNTFQAVIITDGFNSFLMYNYPKGGIQWVVDAPVSDYRYWTQATGIPVAGWNAGDDGNSSTLNIKGSGTLVAMYNLDKKAGNTGLAGRYFWRIENRNRRDAKDKCFTWISLQQQANILNLYSFRIQLNPAMACPCSLSQALLDRRFFPDWWFTGRDGCFITRRPVLFDEERKTVMRQRCCYSIEFGSLLIGPPNGGRLYLTPFEHRWNAQKVFYDSDQQAYEFCCFGSALCDLFYSYRPSDDCAEYRVPRRRWAWGDPHFVTLDGANYTFNGLGEYVMIDAQNGTFQLQARTGLAQGNSTAATIFTALAAKESNTASVEVKLRDGGGIEVLIDRKAYVGYNNLTNQSVELIDENLSVSKPEESCFEVYFPSTTSMQFCENKKMLSFVVVPAEIYKNATKGLLGTWNDDPSDEFTLPNGTVLGSSSSLRDIHFGFGVTWQLTQVQSLFTYGENESVDTFARPDFVPMFSDNIVWSDNSVRLAAEEQCGNDKECLFDVASTNDLSVGIATKDISAQLVNESNILENFPPKFINLPSALNVTLHETLQLEITAEDDGMITFVVLNKPHGATENQTGNVLQFMWPVNSTKRVNISFVAIDDKGASTTWTPTINMCACQHGGQCVPPEEGDVLNTDSKFVYSGCACQDGYSGRFCDSNLDACEVSGQPCYAGVECVDLPPPANATGYTCGPCPTGFTGNGAQCADIDECDSGQSNNCEQLCTNLPGSFFCDCREGFKLNADTRSCDDINECQPTSDCMQQCTNTQGSYTCSCNEYFTQDPNNWKNCTAINPCSADHGCSQVCFKGAGNQPTCACFTGYELQSDGKTCKDINECDPVMPRHRCLQLCENTPGSFNCSCITGFQLTKDGYGCEDVNECLFEELYTCVDEFQRCVNTLGSYKCECDQGLYFIDGKCRGLNRNETAPTPTIPPARVPSLEEEKEAVKFSIPLTTDQYEWDFQTDKSFKEKVASVTTSYCTRNRRKCALKEAKRKRRALPFDFYTADQVNLLPDYPSNASGSLQVAFYVLQPLGLFIGNTSVLPRDTLVDIVKTHESEIEATIGANISRVETLFQSPSTPTTKQTTTMIPTEVKESDEASKWIAIGVGIGVFVTILILLVILW
ncbi:mucin-like protein [Porites lutea]|uniref:mucin-like protein n=1 Tax=Porites lutea TaxID=51062 RepID=UPI003CC5DDFD